MSSTIELNAPQMEPHKQRHWKSLDEEEIFGPPIVPEPSRKQREISPLEKQEQGYFDNWDLNAKEHLQQEMERGSAERLTLPSSPKAALDAERAQKRIGLHKT